MATNGFSSSSTQSTTLSTVSPLTQAHRFISLKLTVTNYLFWKTQLVPFLCGENLMDFVNGTHPCTPSQMSIKGHIQPQANPAHFQWTCQDQYVMSTIISSFFKDIFPLIIGATTSREVWTKLEAALTSSSKTRILNLHNHLHNISQKDKHAS